MLANPLSSILFTVVLWRFFSERIRYVHSVRISSVSRADHFTAEEYWLMRFFGADYVAYKAKVPARLPFIA